MQLFTIQDSFLIIIRMTLRPLNSINRTNITNESGSLNRFVENKMHVCFALVLDCQDRRKF
ncbi:hypothetical protein DCAR_0102560 [Daucus carota subsp. sativus]|uniref:Uncharacterized protein n=1 Tax=Daucus carota subsp. sativus TaxID=79200 RepID=A0A162B490_DAUCS|nr:hypothetical protein DCAR_0102560 [Daucus carota subsp. sativus]